MGSHAWEGQCPYCGFEEMSVSSYDSLYFEVTCQVCGYSRWTEEKVPSDHDVELAKRELSKMSAEEKQEVVEQYYENGVPLIARLRGTSE